MILKKDSPQITQIITDFNHKTICGICVICGE